PVGAATVSPRIWYGEPGDTDTPPNDGQPLHVEFFRVFEVESPVATATSEIGKSGFDAIMDAIAARGLKVQTVREALNQHYGVTTPTISQPWLKSVTRPFLN